MTETECPTCGRDDFASVGGMKIHHNQAHGESIAGVEIKCDRCGSQKLIEVSHYNRTERNFCSDKCRSAALSESRSGTWEHTGGESAEVVCSQCGTAFERYASRIDGRKHFCDDSCRAEYWSENFSGEDCWFWQETHHNWKGGSQPYGPGWNKTKKEAVRIRDQARCQNCGRTEPEHIEEFGAKHTVHHITPARDIDDPEERNAMENLITLCRGKCHQAWEKMAPLRPTA